MRHSIVLVIALSFSMIGCAGSNRHANVPSMPAPPPASDISTEDAMGALAKNAAHSAATNGQRAYDWTFSDEHKEDARKLYEKSKEAAKVASDKAMQKLKEKLDD